MKHYLKKSILSLIVVCHVFNFALAQNDLDVAETVNYINKKFSNSPYMATNQDAWIHSVRVDYNGKIHVTTTHSNINGTANTSDISFFAKDVKFISDSTESSWETGTPRLVYNDYTNLKNLVKNLFEAREVQKAIDIENAFIPKHGKKVSANDKVCFMVVWSPESNLITNNGCPSCKDDFELPVQEATILLSYSYLDNNIVKSFIHLTQLINADKRYTQIEKLSSTGNSIPSLEELEGVTTVLRETTEPLQGTSSNIVPMEKLNSGLYNVPVIINGVLKISFVFDSGASDVSISPDVAFTLVRTGTIRESDFIGTQKYRFADGTTANSNLFLLRELKIGNKTIVNVRASISNSLDAPMLLGQSVLQEFGKFSIDNINHTLTIE